MEKTLNDLYPNGMSMYDLGDKTGGTCSQSREYQSSHERMIYTIECKIGGTTHRLQELIPYSFSPAERNMVEAKTVLQLYILIKAQ